MVPAVKEEEIAHDAQPVPLHGGLEPPQFVGPLLKRFAFALVALE